MGEGKEGQREKRKNHKGRNAHRKEQRKEGIQAREGTERKEGTYICVLAQERHTPISLSRTKKDGTTPAIRRKGGVQEESQGKRKSRKEIHESRKEVKDLLP